MLAAVANDQNIEIILNASVASLDREHDRIAGASGMLSTWSDGGGEDQKEEFAARFARGLVLAAGGFGADAAFRVTQHAALGPQVRSNAHWHVGPSQTARKCSTL